jgi:hypothetical protein
MSSVRAKDTDQLLGCRASGWSNLGKDLDIREAALAHGVPQLSLNLGASRQREKIDEHQGFDPVVLFDEDRSDL